MGGKGNEGWEKFRLERKGRRGGGMKRDDVEAKEEGRYTQYVVSRVVQWIHVHLKCVHT